MSDGTTGAGGQVTYEAIEPPDVLPPAQKAQDESTGDGWKSRKFWVANGSAFATLSYAGAARALGWIAEPTLMYLVTTGLIAVALYCGFNLAEKIRPFKSKS